jgi:hypothetical protein
MLSELGLDSAGILRAVKDKLRQCKIQSEAV